VPAGETQQNLFWRPNTVRQNTLMAAVDQINGKLGRGTLRMAAEGFDHPWSTRFQYKSPRYTTCWEELPVAFAF
jgi:DNA polymerase V